MHFFFTDLAGFGLATLLACVLIVAPGFAIAHALRGRITVDGQQGLLTGWELLIGLAILPVIDALLTRYIGLNAMLGLHGVLAALGFMPMLRAMRQIRWPYWVMLAAWWALVAWSYVDFDYGGRMNQSLLIVDLVKHAAVIHMIETSGIPLHDAFFLRPDTAGYYYYFYLAGAGIDRLGGALVDSRMAFASTVFLTGIAFPALLWTLARQAKWIAQGSEALFLKLCIGLCFVSGLDLIPGIALASARGGFDGQIDWWEDEISFALSSIMWVPHHLTAVMVSFIAFMLLSHARGAETRTRALLVLASGFALASVFGLSIWVALGAGAVLALWLLPDFLQRRFAGIIDLAIAGIIALILSIPQFMDLLGGRHPDGAVLGLWLRPTAYLNLPVIAAIAAIPLAYVLEFGFFLFGAAAFSRANPARQWLSEPLPRLLLISAIVAIILNAFVRSTIINNDFGWRVAWFAQIPLMVWTAVALQQGMGKWPLALLARIALVLGICANIWSLAGWRVIRPPLLPTSWAYVNVHPDVDYETRKAYAWANAHLPANAIIQHNPAATKRVFNFGLYSNNQVLVADREATLFGADRASVAERVRDLGDIYSGQLAFPVALTAARQMGIDYLLVTRADPFWRRLVTDRPSTHCEYLTSKTCIVSVEKIR